MILRHSLLTAAISVLAFSLPAYAQTGGGSKGGQSCWSVNCGGTNSASCIPTDMGPPQNAEAGCPESAPHHSYGEAMSACRSQHMCPPGTASGGGQPSGGGKGNASGSSKSSGGGAPSGGGKGGLPGGGKGSGSAPGGNASGGKGGGAPGGNASGGGKGGQSCWSVNCSGTNSAACVPTDMGPPETGAGCPETSPYHNYGEAMSACRSQHMCPPGTGGGNASGGGRGGLSGNGKSSGGTASGGGKGGMQGSGKGPLNCPAAQCDHSQSRVGNATIGGGSNPITSCNHPEMGLATTTSGAQDIIGKICEGVAGYNWFVTDGSDCCGGGAGRAVRRGAGRATTAEPAMEDDSSSADAPHHRAAGRAEMSKGGSRGDDHEKGDDHGKGKGKGKN